MALLILTRITVSENLHDLDVQPDLPEELEVDLAVAEGPERSSVAPGPPDAEVEGIDAFSELQRTIDALKAVQRHTRNGHSLSREQENLLMVAQNTSMALQRSLNIPVPSNVRIPVQRQ